MIAARLLGLTLDPLTNWLTATVTDNKLTNVTNDLYEGIHTEYNLLYDALCRYPHRFLCRLDSTSLPLSLSFSFPCSFLFFQSLSLDSMSLIHLLLFKLRGWNLHELVSAHSSRHVMFKNIIPKPCSASSNLHRKLSPSSSTVLLDPVHLLILLPFSLFPVPFSDAFLFLPSSFSPLPSLFLVFCPSSFIPLTTRIVNLLLCCFRLNLVGFMFGLSTCGHNVAFL